MLQTDNLHISYGKIRALHGVNIAVEEGEIVTLIGANGAGKSSFLKAVSGVIKPESGSVFFQGERIDRFW
ncbi:hypothetical protein BVX98_00125 [bacterium F11]|nr:hypothetical protein BVX98_00125 [bacterium F11]